MFKQTLDQYFLDFIMVFNVHAIIHRLCFIFFAFEVNLCVAIHIDKRERIMLTALQQDAIIFGCHVQVLVCVFVWVRRIGIRKLWTWQFHLKFKFENCQYISIKADMAVEWFEAVITMFIRCIEVYFRCNFAKFNWQSIFHQMFKFI